jgi:pseudouridine-5'-phosphate glycosidase
MLPDVSADLPELAHTPMIVVCSGAKIVLDLPATREWLETNSVTVVGYECDEMPAFYSRASGLPIDVRCDSPDEVVDDLPGTTRTEIEFRATGDCARSRARLRSSPPCSKKFWLILLSRLNAKRLPAGT